MIPLVLVVGCSAPAMQESINAAVVAPTATRAPSPTATLSLSACGSVAMPATTPVPPALPTPIVPAPLPPPSGRSGLLNTTFRSALIGKEMPILIYLPPGYADSQQRYPTLYMLSGFAGDHREWVMWGLCDAAEHLMRHGQIQPLIVVMPEGERSWWFNHAPAPGSDGKPWGDYVWNDVVNYVDANYRTLPRRESRAIGGLSSGGQSALMLALTHPEVFGVVGAHSPSLRGADGSLPFFGDAEYFKQYDPVWLVQNTTTWRKLTMWIDIGADDMQWGEAILKFHAFLDALGVPHEFHDEWRGAHDSNYWSAHVADYLTWYASKLKGQ